MSLGLCRGQEVERSMEQNDPGSIPAYLAQSQLQFGFSLPFTAQITLGESTHIQILSSSCLWAGCTFSISVSSSAWAKILIAHGSYEKSSWRKKITSLLLRNSSVQFLRCWAIVFNSYLISTCQCNWSLLSLKSVTVLQPPKAFANLATDLRFDLNEWEPTDLCLSYLMGTEQDGSLQKLSVMAKAQ